MHRKVRPLFDRNHNQQFYIGVNQFGSELRPGKICRLTSAFCHKKRELIVSRARCEVTHSDGCLRGINLEALIVVVCTSFGMVVELVIAEIVNHHDIDPENMQHSTMYAMFGLAGIVGRYRSGSIPPHQSVRLRLS